jgi:phosphoadenosine phosphosulfate reductase
LYSYTYDEQTGGILLNSTPTGFSKEPRPVYARELDILRFDKYWHYDTQNDYPYMWAEANNYYYRGKHIAKLNGGNLYTAPEIIIPEEPCDPQKPNGEKRPIEPESDGGKLRPVDIKAMIAKNREMLEIIEQTTVKKILDVYNKHRKNLDIFHVAFSGGKDSMVLLDLIKKTLPKGSFVVVFGDTGMEFPDTYGVVSAVEKQCKDEDIVFRRAKSHLDAKESWELFGPPSRVLRWCCSVHKSAPQTLELRKLTGKGNYVGMDFVGVRSHESINRRDYDYENYGKKQKGQRSHNSILEWTSAEIWLYIYSNSLLINEAYKKGNARAGCLFCPMPSDFSDYMRRINYTREFDNYVDIVKKMNGHYTGKALDTYINNGGWIARNNGRDLNNNLFRCIENEKDGLLTINVIQPFSNWKEWIKTLGNLAIYKNKYTIEFENDIYHFSIDGKNDNFIVSISEKLIHENPTFGKLFKQVFRKAAYCKACRVCETNCKQNCISFNEKKEVDITSCIHCSECHTIDSGCLLFHSLRHPQGGGKTMKSLNSFADHAPKYKWLQTFFELKDDFFTRHSLGPMMFDMFRRFLRDASLMDKNRFTPFAQQIAQIGWESETAWGLILVNLAADNPQFQWYIKNLDVGRVYPRKTVEAMLTALDVKEKDAKSIVKSFKRLVETPLGTKLKFGAVAQDGALSRTACIVSDPRVILYAFYKFAEKCGGYWEFTLTRLLDYSIESDGISPTQIFGLGREACAPLLLGLSAKYPDFINASFTHDLDKISLQSDKKSSDVLGLF